MNKEYVSFGKSDKDIISCLKNIVVELGIEINLQITTQIGLSNPVNQMISINEQIDHSNSLCDRYIKSRSRKLSTLSKG